MTDAPETIYLIHGEDDDGPCMVWCDDPAPSRDHDPAEAVKYVRADKHYAAQRKVDNCQQQAQIWKQEARTQSGIVAEIYEAMTGKKGETGDWNGAAPVKDRIEELETMVKVFRGCIETGLMPELMSPCYQKVISLVGRNADDQKERDGD